MARVILIGDSIRMGYESVVRRELGGLAEVWAPEENGGNSRNVLAHLDEWALARSPDVVHINCGLHDLRREFGSPAHAVPLDEYEANLREILGRLQRETRAILIWATTTPVNEAWHHARKEFDRFEADVRAYNEAAARVTQALGIAADDLYGVVTGAGRDNLLLPDGVHFSTEGYEVLGQAVARAIRPCLISVPADLALRYEWRAASMPPPHHYEYSIRIGPGAQGEIILLPDYAQHNPPVWSEPFAVSCEALSGLYAMLQGIGALTRAWRQPERRPVGDSYAWLEIAAGGKTARVPDHLVPEDAAAVVPVYETLRRLVPEALWADLMARREAYIEAYRRK